MRKITEVDGNGGSGQESVLGCRTRTDFYFSGVFQYTPGLARETPRLREIHVFIFVPYFWRKYPVLEYTVLFYIFFHSRSSTYTLRQIERNLPMKRSLVFCPKMIQG